ncbi:MAG: DUF5119 domain-containing protein [Muribaculaceae bacterium]|nr:DUF5119 domain-containing protein [Muribaculaceae bacterium]
MKNTNSNMMSILHGHSFTIMVIAGLLSTSCHHKDVYMEEEMTSQLQVVFDWSEAPEADPESMALYMYEDDGHNPMRYIFSNKTGGLIKAPFGTRHTICLNADNTDWACMRNHENIETLEIYTQDAGEIGSRADNGSTVPRPEGTENERIAATPGMLWGSRSNDIRIVPHDGMQTITMYPHEAVCHYIVDVYDVKNLEEVESSAVDATLSGMAEGYSHGQQSATDNTVSMKFDLKGNAAEENLHGEFLTFGECPTTVAKHYLTLYMVLTDGSKWYHSFDVTDQVTKAPDPTHVHIIVRDLELPEPPKNGSSELKTDVNEWQAVNIGLKM